MQNQLSNTQLMEEKKYLPVSADSPTVFVTQHGVNDRFDVGPFLETLGAAGSDGMAKDLDDMIQDLTTYYLEYDGKDGGSNNRLYILRLLRNALLTGGGWLKINQ